MKMIATFKHFQQRPTVATLAQFTQRETGDFSLGFCARGEELMPLAPVFARD